MAQKQIIYGKAVGKDLKLEKAIRYMNAAAPLVDPALAERDVTNFVIDSRKVKAGDVFFALSQPEYRDNGFNGDFADSTSFAADALAAGAVAAVVREDRFAEHAALEKYRDRLIFTDDVIVSLQNLAHGVYLEWNKPVVAITGSAGKTTAKELTAHVLESGGRKILRNVKNYNNGLGHPLTVLRLAADDSYDIAVLEMGMSTPLNEIARLCRITPPEIAVELNVFPVHLEHLGTIENIARAKAELVEGMKVGGTAVLNADDIRVAAMTQLVRGRTVTFGIEKPADVSASEIVFGGFGNTSFKLRTPDGEGLVHFRLNGKHNILNALAAAAVGFAAGLPVGEIASQLATAGAPSQRGEVLRFKAGFTVIDDSYNSNPDALLSMVRTLVEGAGAGERKIIIAGEMRELGSEAAEVHRKTGASIGKYPVDELIAVGELGRSLVEGAASLGFGRGITAETADEAGEILVQMVRPGDVILVKGSRGVRTERVIARLLEKFDLEGNRGAAR